MKIGIMGGTFDPIHNGHLMLGEYAYRQFDLDEIWYMPNGNPPHKNNKNIGSDPSMRAKMVELAISGKKHFRLEDYEVKKDTVSYSYETLEYFKNKYADNSFYFIIGADSLFAIERWVLPERIFKTCTILAAYRDDKNNCSIMDEQIKYLTDKYDADIRLLETPVMPVSSSELRIKIREGADVTSLIPEDVAVFIRKNNLYHI